MVATYRAGSASQTATAKVRPSIVDPPGGKPFTLDQELQEFGRWVSDPILVPPKDASTQMAETMLRRSGLLTPKEKSWNSVVATHRKQFTHVRELEMSKASIRLPKGKLFVSVVEKANFDKITDPIPACVQTRLDEFLAGPGRRPGVKVSYLKPLCVEVDDQLVFTTREDLFKAVDKIKAEVFSEYRRMYFGSRPRHYLRQSVRAGLALPRVMANRFINRKQKALDDYQAKLEFQRRKTALRAAKTHGKFRTHGCSFDDMLQLTNPLQRNDVIEQFGIENDLSRAKRDQLLRMAAGSLPWFVALAMSGTYLASVIATFTPPVLVCDPAFVAEMPDAKGKLLKIGHFDEVDGVTHVEI